MSTKQNKITMKVVGDEYVIDFNGRYIDDGTWDEDYSVSASQIADALQSSDIDKVRIIIDSYGGDLQEGLAMYDVITEWKAKKTIVGEVRGRCCSAATLPLFACDTREISANSSLMMHQPTGGAYGTYEECMQQLEHLRKNRDRVYEIYAAVSGKSPEDVQEMMGSELWLVGQEAVDGGWCTSLKTSAGNEAAEKVEMLAGKIVMYGQRRYKASVMARTAAVMGFTGLAERERLANIMKVEQDLHVIMSEQETKMNEIAEREKEIEEELAELQKEKEALEAEKADLEAKANAVDDEAQMKANQMLAGVPVPTEKLPAPGDVANNPTMQVESMTRDEFNALNHNQRMAKMALSREGRFKLTD